jgi:glycosyltransferase involved in cell wall biosynthesis
MQDVKVSILCLTYNHQSFIKHCIDGFLMQKCNFNFEVLIHDDASTDKTAKFINEYKNKFPEIIKPIYQLENQYSKGIKPTFTFNLPRAKGKYIAFCEGDDYWTDPYKLQKQVDFLEANHECNYVFTNKSILKTNGNFEENQLDLPPIIDLHYLLKNGIMPSTQTVMFRNPGQNLLEDWSEVIRGAFNGDWVLLFMHTHSYKIGFINDNTAVYREGVGVISKTNNAYKFLNGLETNKKINELTNFKYDYHIGIYDFHFQNITYSFLENNQKIKGLTWFCKSQFYKIFKTKSASFFSNSNWIFIKHSFKLLFK